MCHYWGRLLCLVTTFFFGALNCGSCCLQLHSKYSILTWLQVVCVRLFLYDNKFAQKVRSVIIITNYYSFVNWLPATLTSINHISISTSHNVLWVVSFLHAVVYFKKIESKESVFIKTLSVANVATVRHLCVLLRAHLMFHVVVFISISQFCIMNQRWINYW